MTAERDAVQVEHADGVCRLTLNRPERGNALGPEMVAALDAGLTEALAHRARLLVFQGAGRNFCTGFDLSGLEAMTDAVLLERFVRVELLLQRIYAAGLTTLAVAHGRTYGAGADLFAACDLRLAVEGARFSFPGSGFGLVLGTQRLAGRIGDSQARMLLLAGGEVGATEAASLCLASAVVDEAAVDAAVSAAARAASRLDPVTVALLHGATRTGDGDAALAALVRSASRPGLRDRVMAYRESTRRG